MPVTVVTDTTQYMPRELIEARGIELVSLYINWPDRQVRESELHDFDAFYDELLSARQLPTTSQPSVGDFLAVYEPILERGDDIVSIHLSRAISGTVASAEQAREELVGRGTNPARIEIVDSRTCAAGQGMVALAAASAAQAGADPAQTVAAANRLRDNLQILFAVDTLEFLRRGGRIGAASAYLGTALKIKPILAFEEQIKPVERVRTASRAFERLVAHLEQRREDGCDVFFVQHVHAPELAEKMAERGREIYGRDPDFLSEIGPVIGTHAGPGLIGVAGMRSDLLAAR